MSRTEPTGSRRSPVHGFAQPMSQLTSTKAPRAPVRNGELVWETAAGRGFPPQCSRIPPSVLQATCPALLGGVRATVSVSAKETPTRISSAASFSGTFAGRHMEQHPHEQGMVCAESSHLLHFSSLRGKRYEISPGNT